MATGKRVMRSKAQRLADAKAEVEKQEKTSLDKAKALYRKGTKWQDIAVKTTIKATNALIEANELISELGFDPDEIWEGVDLEIAAEKAAEEAAEEAESE